MSILTIPKTIVIANGQSLSASVDLGGYILQGIAMPAGWDAATLSFQTSIDNWTTSLEMQSISGVINPPAAAGQFIALDRVLFRTVTTLKVRSGTVGVPVNQTAQRTLTLLLRPAL